MRDLSDPFLSFTDIADGNNTTIEGLSAFLAHPDLQQHIKDLENNIATRARLCAASALPTAVAALDLINKAFAHEERDHPLDTKSSPQTTERRRRFAETCRRASSVILRIARFQGGPPPAPRPPRPSGMGKPPSGLPVDSDSRWAGPAPSDSAPVAPTPRATSESAPPPVPSAQSPAPPPSSLRRSVASSLVPPDLALIRELARGRRTAAKVLHHLTGIPPEPEDDDEPDDTDQTDDTQTTAASSPAPSAQSPVPSRPGPAP
jgi:hypothetical protein